MKDYEINENTLAILPKNDRKTLIYEVDNNYIVSNQTNKIMEESCRYYGSTLDGRKQGAATILNSTHKVPIIVEESGSLIFFPTSSPRLKECGWIALNHVDYYEKDKTGCKIYFKDGKMIRVPVSYGIINNQILRASRLKMMIDVRKALKD